LRGSCGMIAASDDGVTMPISIRLYQGTREWTVLRMAINGRMKLPFEMCSARALSPNSLHKIAQRQLVIWSCPKFRLMLAANASCSYMVSGRVVRRSVYQTGKQRYENAAQAKLNRHRLNIGKDISCYPVENSYNSSNPLRETDRLSKLRDKSARKCEFFPRKLQELSVEPAPTSFGLGDDRSLRWCSDRSGNCICLSILFFGTNASLTGFARVMSGTELIFNIDRLKEQFGWFRIRDAMILAFSSACNSTFAVVIVRLVLLSEKWSLRLGQNIFKPRNGRRAFLMIAFPRGWLRGRRLRD
jgi:hypothetical protein